MTGETTGEHRGKEGSLWWEERPKEVSRSKGRGPRKRARQGRRSYKGRREGYEMDRTK